MDRMALVLVAVSHLANVLDLTVSGWRITAENVANISARISSAMETVNSETVIVVLQLYDRSVFMVGGVG